MTDTKRKDVARWYDESTTSFFTKYWDDQHLHFGYYDESCDSIEHCKSALERMIEKIIEPAVFDKTDTVVDAGCGIGGTANYLASRFGCRVFGFNVSRKQIDIAKQLASERKLEKLVQIGYADCSDIFPISGNSVDKVVSIEAACHFEDKLKFMKESARMLKPNGFLLMSDWVTTRNATLREKSVFLERLCKAWHIRQLESLQSYSRMLREVGLECVHIFDLKPFIDPNLILVKRAAEALGTTNFREIHSSYQLEIWTSQISSLVSVWEQGCFSIAGIAARKCA